jgi:starch phosphorylase
VVFLEDYDMQLARWLVSGVDVWLNNPIAPLEASGTSGIKAAVNGRLNLSVLDGWWAEACDGTQRLGHSRRPGAGSERRDRSMPT